MTDKHSIASHSERLSAQIDGMKRSTIDKVLQFAIPYKHQSGKYPTVDEVRRKTNTGQNAVAVIMRQLRHNEQPDTTLIDDDAMETFDRYIMDEMKSIGHALLKMAKVEAAKQYDVERQEWEEGNASYEQQLALLKRELAAANDALAGSQAECAIMQGKLELTHKQQQEANLTIRELQGRIEGTKSLVDSITIERDALHCDLKQTNEEVTRLTLDADHHDDVISQLKSEIEANKDRYEEIYGELAKRHERESYENREAIKSLEQDLLTANLDLRNTLDNNAHLNDSINALKSSLDECRSRHKATEALQQELLEAKAEVKVLTNMLEKKVAVATKPATKKPTSKQRKQEG